MGRLLVLSVALILFIASEAASFTPHERPAMGRALLQHTAESPAKECGKSGSCSPVEVWLGPKKPGAVWGTPVMTCWYDGNGNKIRCDKPTCYDFCP
jgi:hypothetical protein